MQKKILITLCIWIAGFGFLHAQTPLMQLELVKADPNPYYDGESGDHFVRINNLPYKPVTVQIFTLNNVLIRMATVDDRGYWDWDLKKDDGEEASTGLYLVKIDFEGASRTFKLYIVIAPKMSSF